MSDWILDILCSVGKIWQHHTAKDCPFPSFDAATCKSISNPTLSFFPVSGGSIETEEKGGEPP